MAIPDPKSHPYDVVVVGAGGAGLRAAIEASAPGAKTALVCKSLLGKAHTVMAEGGSRGRPGERRHPRQLAGPLPRHDARRQVPQPVADGPAACPGGARPGARAGGMGGRLRSHQGGRHSAAEFRRAHLSAAGPRRRSHRPRDDPHAPGPGRPPGHRRLHGMHDPRDPQGRQPRLGRLRLLARERAVRGVQGQGGGARDGRHRPLLGDHLELLGVHGRRACDGDVGRRRPDRHGVRPVPPDRHGLAAERPRDADHRGRARRRGRVEEQRGERFMFHYIPEMFKGEFAETEEEADRWVASVVAGRRPDARGRRNCSRATSSPGPFAARSARAAARRTAASSSTSPRGGPPRRSRRSCPACITSSRSWRMWISPRTRWRSARPATT